MLQLGSCDVLHGDENGLLLIPDQARAGLAEAVEKVRSGEGKLMGWVRGADFSLDKLNWERLE